MDQQQYPPGFGFAAKKAAAKLGMIFTPGAARTPGEVMEKCHDWGRGLLASVVDHYVISYDDQHEHDDDDCTIMLPDFKEKQAAGGGKVSFIFPSSSSLSRSLL